MSEDKLYEKGSLADLAARGLKKITLLSKSQLISRKLQSFDMLLFVFIATFIISGFWSDLIPNPNQFVLGVILGISFLFGLIANIIYDPILDTFCNYASNKIKSLRTGTTLMFIALTVAIAGFVFDVNLLYALALGLVLIHLIVIPLGNLFFSRTVMEDKKIEPRQMGNALGKINVIIGIINIVIGIIMLGISLFRLQ